MSDVPHHLIFTSKKPWIIFQFHRQLPKISKMFHKDDVFSSFELNLSSMRKYFAYSFLFILSSFFRSIKPIKNYCRPKCFLILFFLKILKTNIRFLELFSKVFHVSFVSIRIYRFFLHALSFGYVKRVGKIFFV